MLVSNATEAIEKPRRVRLASLALLGFSTSSIAPHILKLCPNSSFDWVIVPHSIGQSHLLGGLIALVV